MGECSQTGMENRVVSHDEDNLDEYLCLGCGSTDPTHMRGRVAELVSRKTFDELRATFPKVGVIMHKRRLGGGPKK